MKSFCTIVYAVILIPLTLMAQGTITGTVTDMSGNAVHGANVVVEGTGLGAATDAAGYFIITGLPAGETIVIVDFIGFKQNRQTVTVPSEGSVQADFTLVSSVLRGEEIVVVGYGTQLRREITGSVAQVSDIAFRDIPVLSFENAIQGQISGVDVSEYSGAPGAAPNIRIRGSGSITAGNDPLYVIDGLPITKNLSAQGSQSRRSAGDQTPASNPLASINPNDIESIQILKDASAAAIYGSRGSNGVVIITTKKAKEGDKPTIRFDSYTGTQEVTNIPDMMNAEEVIAYTQDSRNNAYIQQYDPLNPASDAYNADYDPTTNVGRVTATGADVSGTYLIPEKYVDWDGTDTDWLSLIFNPAPISNYNLSVSGGGADYSYFVSGGYLNQEGIIEGSQFQRYTISARLNGQLNKSVRFGANLNSAYSENNIVPANAPYFRRPPGIVYSALVASPVVNPYNADGTINQLDGQAYLGNGTTDASNPLAIIEAITETLDNHRTLGNVYTDINLMEGMVFRSSVGADLSNYQGSFYRANSLLYRTAKTGDPFAQSNASRTFNWLWENTINYKTSFKEIHNFTVLVGYTAQRDVVDMNSVIASKFRWPGY
ncbi:SusC/RagA family TonB-linked outer membrane protein [Candidatus Neomarinimicrobiota bacterium]